MARRAGRRWLGALVVLVIILAGLFIAVDRFAVGVAEQAMADSLRSSQQLPSAPGVRIEGFPFLTQAVRGRYDRVQLEIDGIEAAGGVRVQRLDARLEGVHVPLRDALRRQVERVPVDRATAVATIGFDALRSAAARQLDADQLRLDFAASGRNGLRVTGRYSGPAGPIGLDTVARLSVRGGRLRVSVPQARLESLPEPLRPELARLLNLTLDLPDLPLGFRPVAVSVDPQGVSVRAAGRRVVLEAGR